MVLYLRIDEDTDAVELIASPPKAESTSLSKSGSSSAGMGSALAVGGSTVWPGATGLSVSAMFIEGRLAVDLLEGLRGITGRKKQGITAAPLTAQSKWCELRENREQGACKCEGLSDAGTNTFSLLVEVEAGGPGS